MADENTVQIRIIDIDTTEEFILNPAALPEALRGWRNYRIEYGGPNECCIWEGRLMLPPRADPQSVANLIMGMQAYEKIWTPVEDDDKEEKEEQ